MLWSILVHAAVLAFDTDTIFPEKSEFNSEMEKEAMKSKGVSWPSGQFPKGKSLLYGGTICSD